MRKREQRKDNPIVKAVHSSAFSRSSATSSSHRAMLPSPMHECLYALSHIAGESLEGRSARNVEMKNSDLAL